MSNKNMSKKVKKRTKNLSNNVMVTTKSIWADVNKTVPKKYR